MSRIRSRQLESGSVPTRALRDKASTSRKIGTHAVRATKEAWPTDGLVSEGQLDGTAVTFIEQRISEGGVPALLTVEAVDAVVANATSDPVEFGAVPVRSQIVEWDTAGTEVEWPFGGSVFFYLDVDPGTYAGPFTVEVLLDDVVTWTVEVPATTSSTTIDYQLWTDSTGQVWLVEMSTAGAFTTTAITPLTVEGGGYLTTEGGTVLTLES